MQVFSADLAGAKASLYNAIRNAALTASQDGIIDTHLHPSSKIGLATIGNHILIRPTRIGDLNLDGTVSIADFIILASNFNLTGTATWQDGDLNYDRSVTISDFIDLASNFNTSYGGEVWPISDADAKMLSDFAQESGASVPEPAALGMLLSPLLLLARKRRV